MKVRKLERTTLLDQAYEELKAGLMRGDFLPGTVLSARSLAKDMGTSVMPARDAIQRLVAERGLTMLPNRMAQVPTTSLDEFNALTEIRIRLEGLAAARAAQRVTEAEIATIERQNVLMQAAVEDHDATRMLEANTAFHFSVYRASQSELLISQIETMWLRIGPLLLVSLDRNSSPGSTFSDGANKFHIRIIEALRARDAGGAEEALVGDIVAAAEWNAKNNSMLKSSDPSNLASG